MLEGGRERERHQLTCPTLRDLNRPTDRPTDRQTDRPTDRFSRPKSPEEGPEERFSSILGRFGEHFRGFSRFPESTRAFFGKNADVEQTPRGASPNCSPQGGACGKFSEFRRKFVFLLCEKVRANSDGQKTSLFSKNGPQMLPKVSRRALLGTIFRSKMGPGASAQ